MKQKRNIYMPVCLSDNETNSCTLLFRKDNRVATYLLKIFPILLFLGGRGWNKISNYSKSLFKIHLICKKKANCVVNIVTKLYNILFIKLTKLIIQNNSRF